VCFGLYNFYLLPVARPVLCMVESTLPNKLQQQHQPDEAAPPSHIRRGRFSLGPLLPLPSDDADTLRDATLRKDTDCEKPASTRPCCPRVRRVGRFECEAAEPCELIKRRRVGRFDVVTVPTACMVSRSEDPSQMAMAVLRHAVVMVARRRITARIVPVGGVDDEEQASPEGSHSEKVVGCCQSGLMCSSAPSGLPVVLCIS
ncbi:hypothetical protein FOZ63_004630, partial [Perkinsus olseni]